RVRNVERNVVHGCRFDLCQPDGQLHVARAGVSRQHADGGGHVCRYGYFPTRLARTAVMELEPSLRERLTLQVMARCRLPLAEERAELEDSLLSFVEGAWPSLDPSAYQSSWAIEAVCEHLQAVTEGQIKKLLINQPPRTGKTLVASVCFPAWTW